MIDQTTLLGAAISVVVLTCIASGILAAGTWALFAVLRVVFRNGYQDNAKRRGSDDE